MDWGAAETSTDCVVAEIASAFAAFVLGAARFDAGAGTGRGAAGAAPPTPVCLQRAAERCYPRGSWVQKARAGAAEAAQFSNVVPPAYLLRWGKPARRASFDRRHQRPPERRAAYVVVLVFAGSSKVRARALPQPETGTVALTGLGSGAIWKRDHDLPRRRRHRRERRADLSPCDRSPRVHSG